jgi:flavin-dependent dehydrogenase
MKEVVIVGGGPVGLWTAIQIKKRDKDVRVTIYERYEEYKRSHVLRLDHWSMILYNKNKNDYWERSFINDVTGKSKAKMNLEFVKSLYIKTNDLESGLKEYAKNLGVKTIIKKVESCKELEDIHKDCKHFIAADGAHSNLRKILLGDNDKYEKPLQYVVELKFFVNNKTKKTKDLKDLISLNLENKYMNFEYIGRYKNGETPITARFFLNKDTYEKIPEASFKEPLSLKNLEKIEELKEFKENLEKYINFRKEKYGDEIKEDSIKISKLILSVYAAKKFAILNDKKDKCWFLTGDCALGVPYFRALNSGIMLSSRLSQILNSKIAQIGNEVDNQYKLYRIHEKLHIETEFAIAYGKNMILNSANKVRQMKK